MKKESLIIWILSVVVLVLVLFILYVFVFLPSYNNFVIKNQVEGQQILIYGMIQQIQQEGYASIPLNQNESLVLVPYQRNASFYDIPLK